MSQLRLLLLLSLLLTPALLSSTLPTLSAAHPLPTVCRTRVSDPHSTNISGTHLTISPYIRLTTWGIRPSPGSGEINHAPSHFCSVRRRSAADRRPSRRLVQDL